MDSQDHSSPESTRPMTEDHFVREKKGIAASSRPIFVFVLNILTFQLLSTPVFLRCMSHLITFRKYHANFDKLSKCMLYLDVLLV